MGEGFGDYLAAAYSTEMSGFDNEWTPCIMEWDATSYDDNSSDPPGICLRRGDDPDSRPDQIDECDGGSANIHCIGQVWSSALLDLRALLGDDGSGRSIVDRIVLDSHFALPSNATFEEAAERCRGRRHRALRRRSLWAARRRVQRPRVRHLRC